MGTKRNSDYVGDVVLDTQTGEISGNPRSVAWLLHIGAMKKEQVLPKCLPEFRKEVEDELKKMPLFKPKSHRHNLPVD